MCIYAGIPPLGSMTFTVNLPAQQSCRVQQLPQLLWPCQTICLFIHLNALIARMIPRMNNRRKQAACFQKQRHVIMSHTIAKHEQAETIPRGHMQQECIFKVFFKALCPDKKTSWCRLLTCEHIGTQKFIKHAISESAELIKSAVMILSTLRPVKWSRSCITLRLSKLLIDKWP